MAGIWTITYDNGTGAVEKPAAAWGLTAQPFIRTRDRSETVFSFRMAGAAPEGAIPFPHYLSLLKTGLPAATAESRARVIIKQNRTYANGAWSGSGFVFTGYLMQEKGRVSGAGQGIVLDFADAIWLMKNTTFQQLWKKNVAGTGGSIVTTLVPAARVVLFMDIASYVVLPWTIKSVQWQINEILTYAAACGIAIAAGTLDYSGWYLNYYQVKAISIWDAILKCLEPVADAKVWVDGSLATPVLNVRTRANLAALAPPAGTGPGPVTLPYKTTDAAGRMHHSTDFVPRYDLVPSQVVLQYQTNNTVNGMAAPAWSADVYPPGSTGQLPFALVAPIDLTGASVTTETGQLDCEALACIGGTHAQKRAWWASKRGGENAHLADFRVRFGASTIGDATVTDDNGNPIDLTAYPNRLVKGPYHAWMKNGATQINAIRAHVRVKVQYAEYDVVGATPAETDTNGNRVRNNNSHELHCHITLTNSPAGITNYNGLNITQTAEVAAVGLAQNIYNSRAALDWDGTHEIVDPGLSNGATQTPPLAQIIGHWNVLNVSGGNPLWATANMTIAGSEIDLVNNHQRIDVGPAKHLAPQDFNELLQFFRSRQVFMFAGQRATGYGDQNSVVDMARNTPDANTVAGLVAESQHVLIDYATPRDPTTPIQGQSNLDANLITQILAATTPTPVVGNPKIMQPTEHTAYDENCNLVYYIVHRTGTYTKP